MRVVTILGVTAWAFRWSGIADIVAVDQAGRIAVLVAYAFVNLFALGFSQPRLVVRS